VIGLWATKSEGVGLIVRAVVILTHERYRRTDRWTDDMQLQYCALRYSASCGKNGVHDGLCQNLVTFI